MMNTEKSQKLLYWFNGEKLKDQNELKNSKDKLIKEIKKLDKESLFPKPKKISIWKKIKIILLG